MNTYDKILLELRDPHIHKMQRKHKHENAIVMLMASSLLYIVIRRFHCPLIVVASAIITSFSPLLLLIPGMVSLVQYISLGAVTTTWVLTG